MVSPFWFWMEDDFSVLEGWIGRADFCELMLWRRGTGVERVFGWKIQDEGQAKDVLLLVRAGEL